MENFKANSQENKKNNEDTHGISKGCILTATEDMAFFGLKKGDSFPVRFDGEFLKFGSLTWGVKQLNEEIDGGVWEFKLPS